MSKIVSQLQIFYWFIKNSKWIYVVISGFYIICVPVLGYIFLQGIDEKNILLVYSYIIYIAEILVAVGCFIPLLLNFHGVFHHASRDCVIISKRWNERNFFFISFLYVALLIFFMMSFIAIMYAKHIGIQMLLRDMIDFFTIAWFLLTFSHLISKITNNVFFALIVTEMYSVTCWFLGVGIYNMFNIYSIELLSGFSWLARVASYVAVGIVIELIIESIEKSKQV